MKNRIALRIAALAAAAALAGQSLAIVDSTTDNQLPSMRGDLPVVETPIVETEEVYTTDTYDTCPRRTCNICPRLRCNTCPRRTCHTCAPKVRRSCNSCNTCSRRYEVGEMDDVVVDRPLLNNDRVLGMEVVDIDADYTANVSKGNAGYQDKESDIEEMDAGGDYVTGW